MGTENLFIVGYGLSGGFGGIQNYVVIQSNSIETASKIREQMKKFR